MHVVISFGEEAAQVVIAALRREARMWGAMTPGCRICTEVADAMEEELRQIKEASEARTVPMPSPPYSAGF